MSFHTAARRVRRSDLPFANRRSALRSCIESYCWLTRQKFNFTYQRLSDHFGFDLDVPDAGERLNRALDAMETERHLFLEQLHSFERTRSKQKMRGCRTPAPAAITALYNIKFVVPKR